MLGRADAARREVLMEDPMAQTVARMAPTMSKAERKAAPMVQARPGTAAEPQEA